MPAPERVVDRIRAHVVVNDSGCWIWQRSRTAGYGQIGWHDENGRPHRGLTHRLMYEAVVGQIPDGLTLDHRCHDPLDCQPPRASECPHRACCNPDHLEPATRGVNTMRGGGFAPVNAAKTLCPQGHPYDDTNTYFAPNGWRQCRTCRTEHVYAHRRRHASAH